MITFKRINYKNFLSSGNQPINIPLDYSQTTLVVGTNGSGKSTLLDALCFALFNRPFRIIKKEQIITQAGILNERKDQSTFAHSPEPLKTISKTSFNGKVAIIKSNPGPQPGTWSLGRFWSHTCLDATATPKEPEITKIVEEISLARFDLGSCREKARKIMPITKTATRWKMHSGQGSRFKKYSANSA